MGLIDNYELRQAIAALEKKVDAIIKALSDYANDGGPAMIKRTDGGFQWVLKVPGHPTLPPRDFELRQKMEGLKK